MCNIYYNFIYFVLFYLNLILYLFKKKHTTFRTQDFGTNFMVPILPS